jgi:hypothetical protein
MGHMTFAYIFHIPPMLSDDALCGLQLWNFLLRNYTM